MHNKLKYFINHVNKKVPHIPDFGNSLTIFRIFIVSMFLSVIYTFSQLDMASNFYAKIIPSTKIFLPYLVSQLLLLILFAKTIKSIKPIYSICLMIFLNIFSVYFVYSNIHKDYSFLFSNLDAGLSKIVVSISILFFFLLYFDWSEKNIDPENLKAKLIYLQSKMKPHFLFNTLNSVVALIKSDPDSAKKILLNLSSLLRLSINDEDVTSMYLLKEEINLCEKYLEIETIRLGARLKTNWTIQNDILDVKVPKLFLQPIVENAVLHGIQNLIEGGTIEISIRKTVMNNIIIEISNPINPDIIKIKSFNNISLKNIQERLNIFYDNQVNFESKIIFNNYCVSIEIPII